MRTKRQKRYHFHYLASILIKNDKKLKKFENFEIFSTIIWSKHGHLTTNFQFYYSLNLFRSLAFFSSFISQKLFFNLLGFRPTPKPSHTDVRLQVFCSL